MTSHGTSPKKGRCKLALACARDMTLSASDMTCVMTRDMTIRVKGGESARRASWNQAGVESVH